MPLQPRQIPASISDPHSQSYPPRKPSSPSLFAVPTSSSDSLCTTGARKSPRSTSPTPPATTLKNLSPPCKSPQISFLRHLLQTIGLHFPDLIPKLFFLGLCFLLAHFQPISRLLQNQEP